jgi:dTDP-glucose pyrophosphorylase
MHIERIDHDLANLIEAGKTAKEALEVINSNPSRTAIIVDKWNTLHGTVTDGDIRRSLLAGKTLSSCVSESMNTEPHFVEKSRDIEAARSYMMHFELKCLPVVDEAKRIVGAYCLGKDYEARIRPNPIIIMAGGEGRRLRPLTETCPKPMLRIANKPMLEILIESYIDAGFHNFYVSVNYLKEQIIDYFGNGRPWGANITYLIEDKPLGTAGSLGLMREFGVNDPAIVVNGDVLTRLDPKSLVDFHYQSGNVATICVREHCVKVPFGVISCEDGMFTGIREKPDIRLMVSAGIYVVDASIYCEIPSGKHIDMPELLSNIRNRGNNISVCPIHEYWLDVGRHETLQEASNTWLSLH